jgi:S1-C subfamily serine protease
MMEYPWLVNEFQRTVPDVPQLREKMATTNFWAPLQEDSAPSILGAVVGSPSEDVPPDILRSYVQEYVDSSLRAIDKIEARGIEAELTPMEARRTEAIIAVWGRPAILIQNGRFFQPPDPWQQLEDHREAIEETIASVGRIQLTGHPRYEWVGTGFMVAEDLVMTNGHVVREFALPKGKKWEIDPPITVTIDFNVELGSTTPKEYRIPSIIGVHPELDLALLRVEAPTRAPMPPPLRVSSSRKLWRKGRDVYIVGFPASDPGRNDPRVMSRIFNDIYEVKRLQPGRVRKGFPSKKRFDHDCSTLGGNSGSCVVDLETNLVVGLHYQGHYQKANQAIGLSELQQDALLRTAGVDFI